MAAKLFALAVIVLIIRSTEVQSSDSALHNTKNESGACNFFSFVPTDIANHSTLFCQITSNYSSLEENHYCCYSLWLEPTCCSFMGHVINWNMWVAVIGIAILVVCILLRVITCAIYQPVPKNAYV